MSKPPLETDIADELLDRTLAPLRMRLITEPLNQEESRYPAGNRSDTILEVCADRMPTVRFAVEYKRQWTPKMVASAIANAEQSARQSGLLPLVVVPYLSEERLLELEGRGISGLDLCGNGVIVVSGKYTVFRSGKPNRFTSSAPIKNIYRGTTSLVARAFLIQPSFAYVNALADFIAAHGGIISRPTVSKALQGMEEDLLLSRYNRPGGSIRLLQPDKLLALLEKNFVPAAITREIIGRSPLPLPELRRVLAAKMENTPAVATGVSSAPCYTALALEEQVALYCRDAATLLEGLPFEPTTRFPNVRLIETSDPTVFFDARPDDKGYRWASPVQTYLEMATGEPRLKQSADLVRAQIVNSLPGEETA